ncbi:PaaI family thioesterase [Roseateles sp. BYS180W]|uniref:PaaI family thioesterase n=1 Tax=Roseateles rivi TaxID=3299028 RepID=A0ABW7FSK9_9BURK
MKSSIPPQADTPTAPLAWPLRVPFVEALGLELWRSEAGQAQVRLALQDAQHNAWAVAHGGVLMTLLDVSMAQAARSLVADAPTMGVVTVELKTSFMQPAQGALCCDAQVLHRTPTLAFCQAELRDAAGRLCAHATGSFKYVRALAVGRGSVQRLPSTEPQA